MFQYEKGVHKIKLYLPFSNLSHTHNNAEQVPIPAISFLAP